MERSLKSKNDRFIKGNRVNNEFKKGDLVFEFSSTSKLYKT